MILQALAATGVSPEEAVMVGDSTYDMEMARAAGTDVIGVSWGYHSPEALTDAGARRIVETVPDLEAELVAMLARHQPAASQPDGTTPISIP